MENRISRLLQRDRTAIMGIINTTPDSFSDGGLFSAPQAAINHGLALVEQGADILDIGGESTRPGATPVPLEQELERVLPVIEALRAQTDVALSIDTQKAEVMSAAASAGADMINDINALRSDGALAAAALLNMPVCLMHMQGDPETMQNQPKYEQVVDQVTEFLLSRVEACIDHGIKLHNIVLDPGIGFGKTLKHNLQLLSSLSSIHTSTQLPMLVGASRKSMIDALLDRAVADRMPASVGLAVQAVLNGAKIVRVHDVQATVDAIRMIEAVQRA